MLTYLHSFDARACSQGRSNHGLAMGTSRFVVIHAWGSCARNLVFTGAVARSHRPAALPSEALRRRFTANHGRNWRRGPGAPGGLLEPDASVAEPPGDRKVGR